MTENKDDLISREALKETIIKICGKCSNNITEYDENKVPNGNCAIWHILNMIDNAPTVEPCYQTTSYLDCKNYDKEKHNCPRFCEVIREIAKENQRPHGEWIKIGEIGLAYKCNKCDEFSVIPENFCPNCGADMRGEEE